MSLTAQSAMLLSKRKDFTGRNDKYGTVVRSNAFMSLGDAKNGLGPFDVTRSLFDDKERERSINRLNRYRKAWKFYRGEHHAIPYQDGEKKPVYNYTKLIANKSVEFMCAKGWTLRMCKGNELVAEVLDFIWNANHKKLLTQILSLYGAVSGDAFLYVTVITRDFNGTELPKDKWRLVLLPINPSYVFPIFDSYGNIASALIQYPKSSNPSVSTELYSVVITPQTFQIFNEDSPVGPPQPNPFGRVNLVHFKNMHVADSNYGDSDIEDIIPVNETYNRIAFSIERTIRYHSEPTTVVKGARVSNLEKGANRVWSGLPVDGDIFNLKLEGDLTAATSYLERLKSHICELGCTPKVCLDGSEMPHSNTPGVSLELMFKPLLDKTGRRRASFDRGIDETNQLILIAHDKILGEPLTQYADRPTELKSTPCWTSPMPRDKKAELEEAKLMLELELISKAELQRKFVETENTERLALELAADKMAALAYLCEKSNAEQGLPPVLSSAFMDSRFIYEDLSSLAEKISAESLKS